MRNLSREGYGRLARASRRRFAPRAATGCGSGFERGQGRATYDLHLLSRRFILVRHFVPWVLLQECRQDFSHRLAVRASRVDDGRNAGDHGAVEHAQLPGDRVQAEIGYIALEFLPDLKVELCGFETGRSRCRVAI